MIVCIGATTKIKGNDRTTNQLEQSRRDTRTDTRQEEQ